jgi:ABC-type polar amino acid transport system ATPase subunit
MSIVVLKDVKKSFGALQVLHGVSFQVEKGEVVALIGASGSGKSTALRCIDRLEKVDSGEIHVCGHRVDDPALDLRKLRLDVGIVFQSYNLFPHLTIEENIILAPRSVKKMEQSYTRQGSLNMYFFILIIILYKFKEIKPLYHVLPIQPLQSENCMGCMNCMGCKYARSSTVCVCIFFW